MVFPQDVAGEFELFARRNPKPAGARIAEPGSPGLGWRLKRTCAPMARLRVWENGECVAEPGGPAPVWRDDLVAS